MKFLLFCLMGLLSFSGFSAPAASPQEIVASVESLKAINAQLQLREMEDINELLKKKVDILDTLTGQLRKAVRPDFKAVVAESELAFLKSRIQVNTERGNELAAQRDKVKLENYKIEQAIRKYLEYLIEASKNYQMIDTIVEKSQALLDKSLTLKTQYVLPETGLESSVYVDLKKNHGLFLQTLDSYQDILNFIINNPRKIATIHWFQEFSLLSAISSINHLDFVQPMNHRLSPFKVDIGGVVISLVIFFLVYFSYPLVFKCTSWCVENFVIERGVEQQELIYHEIRKPARSLLLFFGINLGTYAFFYKTDYRESLEGLSFVIYSILFIWLFFRIVDSVVLVQVQKLSSSNKELRKELFNLGVQFGKAMIVIFVLAFGLNHFGISLTAIMSTLGVGGLAFALAAKDTLSNLFGGITILFDNVFRMGDWVKIGDVEGTVAEIGLRSTTIRTFDNALITIPNSLVSVSSVMNWNRRAVGRRIKMHIGVTYESNMEDVRQCLQDIRGMLKAHPGIANPTYKHSSKKKQFKFSSQADTQGIKSTQLVFMDRYNDFSIDILIYCFSRTVNWAEWLEVKEDVLFKIADILKKNNLEFAYPTQVRIYKENNFPEKEWANSMENNPVS